MYDNKTMQMPSLRSPVDASDQPATGAVPSVPSEQVGPSAERSTGGFLCFAKTEEELTIAKEVIKEALRLHALRLAAPQATETKIQGETDAG